MPVSIDYEWFLLAMVVIAFLRWLFERLGRKGAGPGGEDESDLVEHEDLARRRGEALARQRGEEISPPGDGVDPNEQIRRFFEALGGQTKTTVPPPIERVEEIVEPRADRARRAVPPPLPPAVKRARKPAPPPLTKEERAALAQVQAQASAYDIRQGPAKPLENRELHRLLSEPGAIRNAVLLREILGPPRGLQSTEESHTF